MYYLFVCVIVGVVTTTTCLAADANSCRESGQVYCSASDSCVVSCSASCQDQYRCNETSTCVTGMMPASPCQNCVGARTASVSIAMGGTSDNLCVTEYMAPFYCAAAGKHYCESARECRASCANMDCPSASDNLVAVPVPVNASTGFSEAGSVCKAASNTTCPLISKLFCQTTTSSSGSCVASCLDCAPDSNNEFFSSSWCNDTATCVGSCSSLCRPKTSKVPYNITLDLPRVRSASVCVTPETAPFYCTQAGKVACTDNVATPCIDSCTGTAERCPVSLPMGGFPAPVSTSKGLGHVCLAPSNVSCTLVGQVFCDGQEACATSCDACSNDVRYWCPTANSCVNSRNINDGPCNGKCGGLNTAAPINSTNATGHVIASLTCVSAQAIPSICRQLNKFYCPATSHLSNTCAHCVDVGDMQGSCVGIPTLNQSQVFGEGHVCASASKTSCPQLLGAGVNASQMFYCPESASAAGSIPYCVAVNATVNGCLSCKRFGFFPLSIPTRTASASALEQECAWPTNDTCYAVLNSTFCPTPSGGSYVTGACVASCATDCANAGARLVDTRTNRAWCAPATFAACASVPGQGYCPPMPAFAQAAACAELAGTSRRCVGCPRSTASVAQHYAFPNGTCVPGSDSMCGLVAPSASFFCHNTRQCVASCKDECGGLLEYSSATGPFQAHHIRDCRHPSSDTCAHNFVSPDSGSSVARVYCPSQQSCEPSCATCPEKFLQGNTCSSQTSTSQCPPTLALPCVPGQGLCTLVGTTSMSSEQQCVCASGFQGTLCQTPIPLRVTLHFAKDPATIPFGSTAREQFIASLLQDLSSAVGISTSASFTRVERVASVSSSSVSVTLLLIKAPPGTGGAVQSPTSILAVLTQQLANPTSPLRQGTTSRDVDPAFLASTVVTCSPECDEFGDCVVDTTTGNASCTCREGYTGTICSIPPAQAEEEDASLSDALPALATVALSAVFFVFLLCSLYQSSKYWKSKEQGRLAADGDASESVDLQAPQQPASNKVSSMRVIIVFLIAAASAFDFVGDCTFLGQVALANCETAQLPSPTWNSMISQSSSSFLCSFRGVCEDWSPGTYCMAKRIVFPYSPLDPYNTTVCALPAKTPLGPGQCRTGEDIAVLHGPKSCQFRFASREKRGADVHFLSIPASDVEPVYVKDRDTGALFCMYIAKGSTVFGRSMHYGGNSQGSSDPDTSSSVNEWERNVRIVSLVALVVLVLASTKEFFRVAGALSVWCCASSVFRIRPQADSRRLQRSKEMFNFVQSSFVMLGLLLLRRFQVYANITVAVDSTWAVLLDLATEHIPQLVLPLIITVVNKELTLVALVSLAGTGIMVAVNTVRFVVGCMAATNEASSHYAEQEERYLELLQEPARLALGGGVAGSSQAAIPMGSSSGIVDVSMDHAPTTVELATAEEDGTSKPTETAQPNDMLQQTKALLKQMSPAQKAQFNEQRAELKQKHPDQQSDEYFLARLRVAKQVLQQEVAEDSLLSDAE